MTSWIDYEMWNTMRRIDNFGLLDVLVLVAVVVVKLLMMMTQKMMASVALALYPFPPQSCLGVAG